MAGAILTHGREHHTQLTTRDDQGIALWVVGGRDDANQAANDSTGDEAEDANDQAFTHASRVRNPKLWRSHTPSMAFTHASHNCEP